MNQVEHANGKRAPNPNSEGTQSNTERGRMAVAWDVLQSTAGEWSIIISLIFGGCCSNAWTLELVTSRNPSAGSLITFAQFLLVSLFGLRRQLQFDFSHPKLLGFLPRFSLKPRAIPLSQWVIQVVLFLLINLLNNMAFAYAIPMAVHIIFRSAGLCTNLIMGWAAGKRYTRAQVLSVLIVTVGVAATTLSSSAPKRSSPTTTSATSTDYALGIAILSLALFLSSALGLAQDRAYSIYGRGHWEEGMFYLHFMAMPMFLVLFGDIKQQVAIVNASEKITVDLNNPVQSIFLLPVGKQPPGTGYNTIPGLLPTISVPSFYIPLILNIFTQLLCISGVHRLTSRVSSLTVTLVLVVRKAVSLGISVLILGRGTGNLWLWGGALLVLIGTTTYTMATAGSPKKLENKKE